MLTNDNEDSRRIIETCYKRHKTVVNPIIEWTDRDVWGFIRAHGIPYCELYECGFKRLGCVGCPMGRKRQREREFFEWPKFKAAYLQSFGKMLEERRRRNRPTTWHTAKDVFNWWMEYDVLPGQINLFEEEEFFDGPNIEKVKALIKDGWTKNIAEAIPPKEE